MQYNWCPYQKAKFVHRNRLAQREDHVPTQGKCHVKMENWSDASTSHGMHEATRSQDRGKEWFFPGTSEGTWPCSHLDFGDLASKTETINFCHFKPPSIYYGSLGN